MERTVFGNFGSERGVRGISGNAGVSEKPAISQYSINYGKEHIKWKNHRN